MFLEGLVRRTRSEKTERLGGTEGRSICLGPKRAVKAEGRALMREKSTTTVSGKVAQAELQWTKWIVQRYKDLGDPLAPIYES